MMCESAEKEKRREQGREGPSSRGFIDIETIAEEGATIFIGVLMRRKEMWWWKEQDGKEGTTVVVHRCFSEGKVFGAWMEGTR